jgi:hypothetical protein
MDRKYVTTSLVYALIGLGLGIYMAASKNHGQLVTHAHIMLIGFVVSFIFGLCHKLWLNNNHSKLAATQYYLHQIGTFILTTSLFLHYGHLVSIQVLDPFLALSSVMVFVGVLLMAVLFIKSP